jgi:hypothetical protein
MDHLFVALIIGCLFGLLLGSAGPALSLFAALGIAVALGGLRLSGSTQAAAWTPRS